MGKTKQKEIEMENLSVNQLRQRLFLRKSVALFNKTTYSEHFVDNVPEQIESLVGFDPTIISWENFSEVWDIAWVGLDPRTLKWIPGRHNSPMRKIVPPVTIVLLDERTKRMEVPHNIRRIINEIEVPFKEPLPETEEDRVISESLSGKVVIDEPDNEKAARMIEEALADLTNKLALIRGLNK